MTRIAIVYHSGKGHTAALAEASAEGAASVEGVEVQLLRISHEDIQADGRWIPPPSDRETARRHARRVAQIAHRWTSGGKYETEYIKAM